MHTDGKIFGHEALLDTLDNCSFDRLSEGLQFMVAVKLSSVLKTLGPGKD